MVLTNRAISCAISGNRLLASLQREENSASFVGHGVSRQLRLKLPSKSAARFLDVSNGQKLECHGLQTKILFRNLIWSLSASMNKRRNPAQWAVSASSRVSNARKDTASPSSTSALNSVTVCPARYFCCFYKFTKAIFFRVPAGESPNFLAGAGILLGNCRGFGGKLGAQLDKIARCSKLAAMFVDDMEIHMQMFWQLFQPEGIGWHFQLFLFANVACQG